MLRHRGLLKVPAKLHFFYPPLPVSASLLYQSFSYRVTTFEPRHHFLSIGCRSSSFLSMSPRYRHCLPTISPPDPCSHPFSGFMAPLGFSVSSLSSPSPLFVLLFYRHPVPAQPGFLSASPFIPISAFLFSLSISGVLAAQPASSFLVASVYSTVVLLSTFSITPPRLISDFSVHRSSYRSSVSIASLWPDCGALVSCSVRRFRLKFLEPPSSVVVIVTYYAPPLRGSH